jgi:MFS family permease
VYVSLRHRSPDESATRRSRRPAIPAAVLLLGTTSFFTDISSEMLTAILPIFLTLQLGLTPALFGVVDGLYHGVSAVSRLGAGLVSDRLRRPKAVAVAGYGLSALTRPFLLVAGSFTAVAALISLDRVGKGIRTAPRDAMIAMASPAEHLGYTFGVHRAMDNLGALLGPLLAFGVLLLLPGRYDAVFVVSTVFAVIGLSVLVLLVPSRPRPPARCAVSGAGAPACPRWSSTLRCPTCGSGRPAAHAPAEPRLRREDLRALLRSREVMRPIWAAGLLTLVTVSDAFVFLALLRRDDDLARVFPLFAVGLALAYAVFAVPVGRLADRVGRVRVFVGGHVLLLGVYVVAGGPFGAAAAVALVLLLMGLFYAATDGVLAALVAAVVPEVTRASGLALAQTVVALSAFTSSVAFGLLLTAWGTGTAFAFMAVALVVALIVVQRLLGADLRPTPTAS